MITLFSSYKGIYINNTVIINYLHGFQSKICHKEINKMSRVVDLIQDEAHIF